LALRCLEAKFYGYGLGLASGPVALALVLASKVQALALRAAFTFLSASLYVSKRGAY